MTDVEDTWPVVDVKLFSSVLLVIVTEQEHCQILMTLTYLLYLWPLYTYNVATLKLLGRAHAEYDDFTI